MKFVAHISFPTGVVLPPVEVEAADRRAAAVLALRARPKGSWVACRSVDSSVAHGMNRSSDSPEQGRLA